MNYAAFRDKTKKYPLFRSNIFTHLTHDVATLRRQVSEWVDKGYIIPLKRGIYTLRDEDRATGLSLYFLANNLYTPSYISLETAMSYYGLIPERVYAITSISSKKTQQLVNPLGNFLYHHLKQELYGGFTTIKDEFNNNFFIATPERAVIDLLYFKTRGLDKMDDAIFDDYFRFQNLDLLNKSKLKKIAQQFQQKKIDLLVTWLIKQIGT